MKIKISKILLVIGILLLIQNSIEAQNRIEKKAPNLFFDVHQSLQVLSNNPKFAYGIHGGYQFNPLLGIGGGYEHQTNFANDNHLFWLNFQGSTQSTYQKGWYYLLGFGLGVSKKEMFAPLVKSSPIGAFDINVGRHITNNWVLAFGYRYQHQTTTVQEPFPQEKMATVNEGLTISSRFVLGNEKHREGENSEYSQNVLDKMYVDIWCGIGDGGGAYGVETSSDFSVGYLIKENNAIGVSFTNAYGLSLGAGGASTLRFRGIGMQYRKINQKGVLAMEIGGISRFKDGYRKDFSTYQYLKNKGIRPYGQIMVGFRLNKLILFGVQSTITLPIEGSYEFHDESSGIQGIEKRAFRTVQFVIGTSFN